jgi:hypothetical protein
MALVWVDIGGRGFGLTDSTPRVKIGDTFCRESVWTKPTIVQCKLSPGVGERLGVAVFAGGLSDRSDEPPVSLKQVATARFFSYSAPVITGNVECKRSMWTRIW